MTAPDDNGNVSIDPKDLDLDDGGKDPAAYDAKPQDKGEPGAAQNDQEGGEG